MNSSRRIILLIAITFFMQVIWCALNVHYLGMDSPGSLRYGVSVITSDDASYLASVENFISVNGWKTNAEGDEGLVQRTPGYGLLYLFFRSWLEAPGAILALVFFQICLWALAVAQIPGLSLRFGVPEKASWILAYAIGVLPTFSGFLGYTLTEAITPSLVILVLSFVLNQHSKIIPLAALMGFTILVRPALLPWLLPFIGILYLNGYNKYRISKALAMALLPISIWLGYTWSITEKWQGLHPVYHTNATNLYRPIHGEIWAFEKMWGREGADFHRQMLGYWESTEMSEMDRRREVEKNLKSFPQTVVSELGKEALMDAYLGYIQTLSELKDDGQLEQKTQLELDVGETFRDFKRTYVLSNPFHSLVTVPVSVYGRLAFHSNLSLYIFQKPWRGIWIVELLRWISFALHSLVFLLFLIVPFFSFRNPKIILIWIACASYLGYLCFVQRGVEERYTLPYLIPMLILVASLLNQIYRRLISLNNKS